MDLETKNNLTEGQKVQSIIGSEAYLLIRKAIEEKILDLQSIRNISGSKPEEIVIDIKARNTAIDILMETLRDIEGRAEQHEANKTLIIEDYIINL